MVHEGEVCERRWSAGWPFAVLAATVVLTSAPTACDGQNSRPGRDSDGPGDSTDRVDGEETGPRDVERDGDVPSQTVYNRCPDRLSESSMGANGGAAGAVTQLVPLSEVTHEAVRSGAWNDPSIWDGGSVPDDGAKVRIAPDIAVTLREREETRLKTVRVDGAFCFDPTRDTRLSVDTLITTDESWFSVGSEQHPVAPEVTAEIEFIDTGPLDELDDPKRLGRGLITMGRFQMVGARKTAWHTLSVAPEKGDASFELSEKPTNWSSGDRVVTPGLEPYASEELEHEDEERTIQSIKGRTVRFDKPLEYDHVPPSSDLEAHVLNLTRNVRLTSENEMEMRRGHLMVMNQHGTVTKYVQMKEMGRTDKGRPVTRPLWDRGESSASKPNPRARYSHHFHRTGITSDRHLVKGCVVWNDPGLGYVLHDSSGDYKNNIAYRVTGTGFFTETGTETGKFVQNFALRSWGSGEEADSRKGWSNSGGTKFKEPPNNIDDWGHTGHGFWFQSPLVRVKNNVAAGHRAHGFIFWFRGLYEQPLKRKPNGEFAEKMDGKLTLNPNVSEGVLTKQEKLFGIRGDSKREHSKPILGTKDGEKFYNDTIPIRAFENNVVFGSGAGVSYRSASFRNRDPERGAVGSGGEYSSGGSAEREWDPLWIEPKDFTAYNIGEHWLEEGSAQGQFNNFESSGNVGVDHRYVNALRDVNFRLLGRGKGIGVYNNRSYNDNFDVANSEIRNWSIGFVPGREKSTNKHVVQNCTFAENDIDVLLPEIYGEPESQTWLTGNSYSGNTVLAWEMIGQGRNDGGTSITPRRVLGEHSQITWEGRTVYHGWSDPEFVFIREGDQDRMKIVTQGKTRKKWKKVTAPDDPANVIPGATHRELYARYGITFYGGLLDPSKGERRSTLESSTPGGNGDYAREPFLGPKKPKMPTDEIWIDATKMNQKNAPVVELRDTPNLKYAYEVANHNNLVRLETSTADGNPPKKSTDGFLEYEFEVDKDGPYSLYIRSNVPKFDSTNDSHRRVWYRIDGGSWRDPQQGIGAATTTLEWGKVNRDSSIDLKVANNPHTLEIAAYDDKLDVYVDWFLLKHMTVAANPFHKGLPHTSKP